MDQCKRKYSEATRTRNARRSHAWWARNKDVVNATRRELYRSSEHHRNTVLAKSSAYYVGNRTKVLAHGRTYRLKNRGAIMTRRKAVYKSLKEKVYAFYGAACACCGERAEEFLTIDHKNRDGAEHRRRIGTSCEALYRWIIKNNFPSSIRILCWNCNSSLGWRGYCPHNKI